MKKRTTEEVDMKTFENWLKENHPEIDLDEGIMDRLGRLGRKAALPAAMAMGSLGMGGSAQGANYDYIMRSLKGDKVAQKQFDQDEANPDAWKTRPASQHPTTFTASDSDTLMRVIIDGIESVGYRHSFMSISQTKNVDEGTIVVMLVGGTIAAPSKEAAKKIIQQEIQKKCQELGIQLQDVKEMTGGESHWNITPSRNYQQEAINPSTYGTMGGRPIQLNLQITVLVPK